MVVISIPFLLFAITLSKGKGAFLLAGYNTMSESEKENYEEITLFKFMSKIMYGICLSLLLCAVGEYVSSLWLSIAGPLLMIGLLVFARIQEIYLKRRELMYMMALKEIVETGKVSYQE